ncbi:MAG: hypothetical protein GDA43_16000 [Hormoscilla sp. SP5CHS1]|nr:hypothetical protein [Hormoscilla sp. SP12CHS1]MBC6454508.1 hypothetical protein [Hormoscilla sp. SP5CHS1]MBC6474265.1 hypothetical protein [Hormoscilla sp. GM102CHS1]
MLNDRPYLMATPMPGAAQRLQTGVVKNSWYVVTFASGQKPGFLQYSQISTIACRRNPVSCLVDYSGATVPDSVQRLWKCD